MRGDAVATCIAFSLLLTIVQWIARKYPLYPPEDET